MLEDAKKKIKEGYFDSQLTRMTDGDLDLVIKNRKEIDKKISNAGGLKKYSELARIMVGMLKDYRKGVYTKAPWFTLAAIGLVLLYIFNPFDLVPDFLPGVGYVDDFALFTLTTRFVQTDLHSYLDWKIEQAKARKA